MGYNVHDLFDDKFTPDKIRGCIRSLNDDAGNVSSLLIRTLGLNSSTYSNSLNQDNLMMMILEELFSLEGIRGVCNRYGYTFSMVQPGCTIVSISYTSGLSIVECNYSPIKPKRIGIGDIIFRRCRPFNVDELLNKIEDNKSSKGFTSSLDVFMAYIKSLGNRQLLRDTVSSLFNFKLTEDEVMDTSWYLYYLFSTLSYEEPIELSSIKYTDRYSNISIKFPHEG